MPARRRSHPAKVPDPATDSRISVRGASPASRRATRRQSSYPAARVASSTLPVERPYSGGDSAVRRQAAWEEARSGKGRAVGCRRGACAGSASLLARAGLVASDRKTLDGTGEKPAISGVSGAAGRWTSRQQGARGNCSNGRL